MSPYMILEINTTLPLNLLSLLIILHWSTFLLTFNTTILYCSMKSDRTGTRTQTPLELHQMLYH